MINQYGMIAAIFATSKIGQSFMTDCGDAMGDAIRITTEIK